MSFFRHWKTVGGLLAVFVAGAGIGSVGTVRVIQQHNHERMDPVNWAPKTLVWMHDKLGLTDEQQNEVLPIVERGMQQLVGLRDQTASQRKRIVHDMLVDSAAHMTPEQRERLRSLAPPKASSGQATASLER